MSKREDKSLGFYRRLLESRGEQLATVTRLKDMAVEAGARSREGLQVAEARIDRLATELQRRMRDVEDLEAVTRRVPALEARVAELETSTAMQTAGMAVLTAERDQLRVDLKRTARELAQWKADQEDVKALRKRLRAKSDELDAARADIAKMTELTRAIFAREQVIVRRPGAVGIPAAAPPDEAAPVAAEPAGAEG